MVLDQALQLIQEAASLLNSVTVTDAEVVSGEAVQVGAVSAPPSVANVSTRTATETASPAASPTRPITAPTYSTAKQRSAVAKTSTPQAPPVATLKT